MKEPDFLENLKHQAGDGSVEPLSVTARTGESQKDFLVQVARGLWRLEMAVTRSDHPGTSVPLEIVELLRRIQEELQAFGLETVDPTGKAYISGMKVEIAQFVPKGSGNYVVSQTILPGVTLNGRMLKPPSVIVKREGSDGAKQS
jgi:hypothetical protein